MGGDRHASEATGEVVNTLVKGVETVANPQPGCTSMWEPSATGEPIACTVITIGCVVGAVMKAIGAARGK